MPAIPGRPPHQPTEQTRRTVETMSGYGVPQADIGIVLGISDVTLAKHYRLELDRGMARANAKVAECLFRMATNPTPSGPTVTAAIFWAKTRMGWREVQHIEQTVTTARRAEEMSDDELASIASGGGFQIGAPKLKQ
jgi:hypothetical protein